MDLKKILLIMCLFVTLGFTEKLPTQLEIAVAPKSVGMILLDREKNSVVSQEVFKWIYPFKKVQTKNLAKTINLNGKYGFIDTFGRWVVSAELDLARNFSSDNIARVVKNDKWGYVRNDGTWIAKPQYYKALPFINGFGVVNDHKNGDSYFINNKGENPFNKVFAVVNPFCTDHTASVAIRKEIPLYIVTHDGVEKKTTTTSRLFFGKINSNGEVIIPFTLDSRDKRLVCTKKPKVQSTKRKPPQLKYNNKSGWTIISDKSKKSLSFSEDIIAPLGDPEEHHYAFIDGLIAMVTKNKTISYFDVEGIKQYSFQPNKNNLMTLYDKNNHEIYTTNIKSFRIYSSFARGIEELFLNPEYFSKEKILSKIETMLTEKFQRYAIPNLLYESVENNNTKNLYIIDGRDTINHGVAWLLAQGYVGENAWGNYYYLSDYEGSLFRNYIDQIAEWISSRYAAPIESLAGDYYIWKVKDKILTLKHYGGTGDGDFFHQLAIEINQIEKEK